MTGPTGGLVAPELNRGQLIRCDIPTTCLDCGHPIPAGEPHVGITGIYRMQSVRCCRRCVELAVLLEGVRIQQYWGAIGWTASRYWAAHRGRPLAEILIARRRGWEGITLPDLRRRVNQTIAAHSRQG